MRPWRWGRFNVGAVVWNFATRDFDFFGPGLAMTQQYFTLKDLNHDPDLARALGDMVIAWAYAETILIGVLACIMNSGLNIIQAGYYRIPTFEARIKFIRSLIPDWNTTKFDKAAIDNEVEKLSSISSKRNHWIHGDWCRERTSGTVVIFDHRSELTSPNRRKPVKAIDVKNHADTVRKRADALSTLINYHALSG
jgi:hypothetical protein